MRRTLVLVIGLSLLGAGCVGFAEDLTPSEEENDSSDQPPAEPHGDEGMNDSSNESEENETEANETRTNESENETTANETGENETSEGNETTWTSENRTGTVEGNNLLITHASETESFDVGAGAEELRLNLTAEGGELDVCIKAPSGNESGNESSEESECTAEGATEEGNFTFSETAPTEGEWSVEMTAQGIGPQSVDYELVIAQKVPATMANQTENETADGNESDDDYPMAAASAPGLAAGSISWSSRLLAPFV